MHTVLEFTWEPLLHKALGWAAAVALGNGEQDSTHRVSEDLDMQTHQGSPWVVEGGKLAGQWEGFGGGFSEWGLGQRPALASQQYNKHTMMHAYFFLNKKIFKWKYSLLN